MRNTLTTCAEVAGLVSITVSGFLVAAPLGLLALGVALMVVGIVEARP